MDPKKTKKQEKRPKSSNKRPGKNMMGKKAQKTPKKTPKMPTFSQHRFSGPIEAQKSEK
jgi:hypothetical protein